MWLEHTDKEHDMPFNPVPQKSSSFDGEWVNLPDDMYEFYVADLEEVPNQFYNPATDSPNKQTQIEWRFSLRQSEYDALPKLGSEDLRYSTRPRMWTGAVISDHPKCKLTNLLRTIDPDFDIENEEYYDDWDDFRNKNMYRPVRLLMKENDKGFSNVANFMPSKIGALTTEELLKAQGITVEEIR